MNKINIFIITIFIIFSTGCLEKTIAINADNYSKSIIQHTLELSDKNITKYIDSVTVYNDENIINEKCKSIKITHKRANDTPIDQYVGCNDMKYISTSENADLDRVDMYVLSDDKLKYSCNSEGNTVAYLIGIMENNRKYSEVNDAYFENLYAEEYANQRIKDKCESEEYKKLENKLQTSRNNYNNSIKENENIFKKIEDTYYYKYAIYIPIEEIPYEYRFYGNNLPIKCNNVYGKFICDTLPEDQRHVGIPDDKYSDYQLDYNNYQKAYNNYSETNDNLYKEYSENYDKISDEINITLINYRYPFEG